MGGREGLGGMGEEPEHELLTAENPEHDGFAKMVDGKVVYHDPPMLILGGGSLLSPNGLGAAVISMTWLQPAGTDVTGSAIGIGSIFMSKFGLITTTRTLLTRRSCCFCLAPPAGPATQRTPAASPPLPGRPQNGTAHHPTGQPPRLLTLRGRPETLG